MPQPSLEAGCPPDEALAAQTRVVLEMLSLGTSRTHKNSEPEAASSLAKPGVVRPLACTYQSGLGLPSVVVVVVAPNLSVFVFVLLVPFGGGMQ